jgi:hypothetical protein
MWSTLAYLTETRDHDLDIIQLPNEFIAIEVRQSIRHKFIVPSITMVARSCQHPALPEYL